MDTSRKRKKSKKKERESIEDVVVKHCGLSENIKILWSSWIVRRRNHKKRGEY